MSSAARFLLEFEATGDQEVVNKIRAVGQAGTETASQLQELQGIEDPFAPVAQGAESAITPIEGVGAAAGETAPTLTDMTTEAEAAGTGLTDMGTATEEAAASTEGFGESITTMSGSLAAIGGTIGSVVSSLFRYQDIQLKVQKAQLTSARATEMSRKAEEGLDKVLATAKGNTEGIAAARTRLAAAQTKMNALMDQGVTSGAAFEAAQNEVTAAQKNLSAEFAKGGGDISKLTAAMEKSEINSSKMVVSLNNLEKANREAQQGTLDLAFGFTGMAGSIIQSIGSFDKVKKAAGGFKAALTALPFAATKGGVLGMAAAIAGPLVIAIGAAIQAFQVFRAVPKLFDIITAGIEQNVKKASESLLQLLEIGKQTASLQPLGGATIVPVYDQMIKKLKELLKEKKVEVETNDVTIGSWEELKKTIAGMPAEYQNILNSIMGVSAGTEEYSQVANAATVEAENTAAGIGQIVPAAAAATTAIYDQTNSLANLGTVQEETAKAMEDGVVTEIEFQRIRAATIKTTQDAINKGGLLTDSIKEQMSATAGMVQSAASVEQELQNMGIGMVNVATNSAQVETEISSLGGELAVLRGTSAGVEQEMNNLGTAVGDLRPAFDDAKKAANENAEANNTNAQVILGMIGSIEQEQEALSEVNLAYAESEKKLADLAAVENNARAVKLQMETAINNELASLKEESIALQASIEFSKNAAIQSQALANAKLEGVAAAEEWIASLDEARAKEEAEIGVLKEHAAQFGEFPSVIDPTVEAYQEFIQANKDGGQAAIDFQQKVLDAYNELVSEAQPLLDDLTAAFQKSGEEQSDAMTEAWDKLLPGVKGALGGVQESLIENLANMRAEIERGSQAFAVALQAGFEQGLNLEQATNRARGVFQQFLSEAESESNAAWSGVWDEANQIAETGSAEMIEAAAKAIREGTVPAEVEKQLQNIIALGEPAGTETGTNFSTGLVSGVQQGAGGVEQELSAQDPGLTQAGADMGSHAGIALSEEFAAAGVHIAAVIKGIKANIASIGTGVGTGIVIPVTVDVSQAGNAITSIVNTLSSLQPPPIKLTADVQQAGNAIASIVNTLSSLQVPPIVLTADVQQAGNAIASIVNTLATLKPPSIVVTANTSQAVSALNAASTAALTMRNNFNAASSGVKSAVASAGSAVTSFSSKASSSFAKAGAAGTTMANKVKSASSSMKSSLSSAASSAASFASKCVSSFNKVGSSASSNASKVRNLASAISRLKSKTITITTRYVTSGRPTRGGLQHGGSFIADSPTTIGGTKVGEHYKPELVTVTPLTNPNSLDKTITVNTPGGRGGGSREVVIPVTLMLDNKVLIRTVRRGLVEEVSGTM